MDAGILVDHDENFTGFALDGTAKAEGVQVMLHLIQRESKTDAEGATQVKRKEGGQEEDEVLQGGHNFCWARRWVYLCAVRQRHHANGNFIAVVEYFRRCSNRKKCEHLLQKRFATRERG